MSAIQSGDDIRKQLAEKTDIIEQQANKKEEQHGQWECRVLKDDSERKKANIRSKIEITKKQQIEFWYNILL